MNMQRLESTAAVTPRSTGGRARQRALAAAGALALAWAAAGGAAAETADLVELFPDCNYGGAVSGFPPGQYDLPQLLAAGALNDKTSSVRVPPGYKATLYQHFHFGGRGLTLTDDTACLTDLSFDDVLSSMKVESTADFPVNVTPALPAGPDVAAMADGRFLVVWFNAQQTRVKARLFDAQGVQLKAEFDVGAIGALGGVGWPRVAATDAGFMVVWDGCQGVCAQRLDRSGAPVGGAIAAHTTAGSIRRPAVTGLKAGGFAVGWERHDRQFYANDPRSWDIYARVFDTAGAPTGPDMLVTEEAGDVFQRTQVLQTDLSIAGLDDGFVVGWTEETRQAPPPAFGTTLSTSLKYRPYRISGGLPSASPVRTLTSGSAGGQPDTRAGLSLGAALDGSARAVFVTLPEPNMTAPVRPSQVLVATIATNGDLSTVPSAASIAAATFGEAPDIAFQSDGDGVLTFAERGVGQQAGGAIRGRLLDRAGMQRRVFLVNTTLPGVANHAAVAALPSGFVAVWLEGEGGATTTVRARIVNP